MGSAQGCIFPRSLECVVQVEAGALGGWGVMIFQDVSLDTLLTQAASLCTAVPLREGVLVHLERTG